jgi:predicted phosphodiesterase
MMQKKIGVIGDVHAEEKTLNTVLNFLNAQDLDAILCTGDVIDGVGDVNICFEMLHQADVVTVAGNHERWILKNIMRDLPDATDVNSVSSRTFNIIGALPKTVEMRTPEGLLLLCHGLGDNDMVRLKPYDKGYALESNIDLQHLIKEDKYRLIIGGHTHLKMVRQFGNITIINAGTLRQADAPCFLTIDFNGKRLQFYHICFEAAIYEGEAYTLNINRSNPPYSTVASCSKADKGC